MLHLLRKIRRNVLVNKNLTGYFWYAVGEIGLAVLGILIALQISIGMKSESNRIRYGNMLCP